MNALELYRKNFIIRYRDEGVLYYFKPLDFDGLHRTDVCFSSEKGLLLRGGVYAYGKENPDNLLVFVHGIGPGHKAYLREIETFCRAGYTVLAYDMTGCEESEGETIGSLSQAISDLNACLNFVRRKWGELPISIIGHSLGGYAVGNILAFRSDVKKAVVISGFLSVEQIGKQYFGAAEEILSCERAENPAYADSSAADAYRRTEANVLVIHSRDDEVVDYFGTAALLEKEGYPNVSFLIVDGKKHNPLYTADGVSYMREVFFSFNRTVAEGASVEKQREALKDVDWLRMTDMDDEVIRPILNFLKDE